MLETIISMVFFLVCCGMIFFMTYIDERHEIEKKERKREYKLKKLKMKQEKKDAD